MPSNIENNEIRLMILGKKGEGKTSFAKRFQNLNADMPKEYESTKGIDIHEYLCENIFEEVNISEIDKNYPHDYKDIKIKIWDFAGHEVTHAAHKFFLSDKCVYVIVCQARQGESIIESKIEYWLEHIRDYASGDKYSKNNKFKIFILINEWDDHRHSINEASIIHNFLHSAAGVGGGMEEIMEYILLCRAKIIMSILKIILNIF